MPVGTSSLRHAFSLLRQTDVATAVADISIDKQRGDIDFAPFGVEDMAAVSDAGFFGKREFGTFRERLHQANMLESRSRPASDLDLLFVAAFVMGNHAAVQPDALLLPATWNHTLTWADVGAKPEMDYTSFLEQMGAGTNPGYKEKYTGVWLNQFTLAGQFGDFVTVQFDGGARERATSAATMPSAVTAASLYKMNIVELSFGNAGAEANVDGKWISFSLNFNSNPARKLRSGQPSGEEEFIHRVDRGIRSLTGNVVFEMEDTAFRQKFLADTEVGLILKLQSEDLVDSVRKSATITIPHINIASADFGSEDNTTTYTINLDESSILEKGGDEPVTILLQGDIDNTEIFTT